MMATEITCKLWKYCISKLAVTATNFARGTTPVRMKKAKKSLTKAAKEAGRSLLAIRKEADKADELIEGQLYGAGIVD